MTAWEHTPETEEFSESWKLKDGSEVKATVVRESVGYGAFIHPLGRLRRIGDVYKTAGGARQACMNRLRLTGAL